MASYEQPDVCPFEVIVERLTATLSDAINPLVQSCCLAKPTWGYTSVIRSRDATAGLSSVDLPVSPRWPVNARVAPCRPVDFRWRANAVFRRGEPRRVSWRRRWSSAGTDVVDAPAVSPDLGLLRRVLVAMTLIAAWCACRHGCAR